MEKTSSQSWQIDRRRFLKANAALAAASAIGVSLPSSIAQAAEGSDNIQWHKAPCRFCGVGCSVLVGTRDNKIVATKGNPDSSVNRGMLCIKGSMLSKVLYGKGRLTTPLLRMKNGQFAKDGELTPVTWERAYDEMASRWKASLKAKGPTSVGMFGSGQWTVWDGYAASKLMKAGFRSNNIDPNARHCMASAVVGFLRAFGIDEPMGCYADIEHADDFVLWGSNAAEAHPILWNRMTARRLSHQGCNIHVLSTYQHRCFDMSDNGLIFKPHTDLILLNYIANYIIQNNAVNWDFVNKHTQFAMADSDIGYGLRPTDPRQQRAKNPDSGKTSAISFEQYAKFLEKFTLEHTVAATGVNADALVKLAKCYADPNRKVMSLWCMGVNQHTRGVWANNSIYNLHLLTGKIATPGNSPFSLTGQPSACGTAREVGTFAHRLPADMVVANPKHRAIAEKHWQLPAGTIPPKPGFHAVLHSRMLKDGVMNCYWTQCTNNLQAGPNSNQETLPGFLNPDNFITVSDAYMTVTASMADLVLPTAMWVEKEGAFGNAERRGQYWHQLVKPVAGARSDVQQIMEFSQRFQMEDVWPEALLAQAPQYRGKSLYQVLFANGVVNQFNKRDCKGPFNDENNVFGYYVHKGLFEEYAAFTRGNKHDLGDFDAYYGEGLMWPVVKGKETQWRFKEGSDPYVPAGAGYHFYGKPNGKAVIIANDYEPPAESPDAEHDLWMCTGRILEHWHTGTMTRRIPELHKAFPNGQVFMNGADAQARGLSEGDEVIVANSRGEVRSRVTTNSRYKMPPGVIFMAFFDESQMVNKLVLDATDPLSKETDFKKTPVKVVKA